MTNVFTEWLGLHFEEVDPLDFYRSMFPEGELEKAGEQIQGMYTAIAIEITDDIYVDERTGRERPVVRRHTITDDLSKIGELCRTDNFCLISPLSYAGRNRTAEHARFCYGIAIDLDRIVQDKGEPYGLINLWYFIEEAENRPRPTYIVSSGTGVHLYYLLETPIPMFADIARQLQELKRELTDIMWHVGVVDITDRAEVQQEGIYQGFRVVGTVTKNGERARAFETGPKVTIDYLNSFVDERHRVQRYAVKRDPKKPTLAQAKEKWPDWYESKIIRKEKSSKRWHTNRAVYEWWKTNIYQYAVEGHRYYCVMILAMYAQKCGVEDSKHNPNPVTYEELEADAYGLQHELDRRTKTDGNQFDAGDIADALEAYNERYIRFPVNRISALSGVTINRNKRNYQKQADHLEEARAIRDIRQRRKGTDWRDNNGRKSKEKEVKEWRQRHPEGGKLECIRETGLSRTTVYKYWNV